MIKRKIYFNVLLSEGDIEQRIKFLIEKNSSYKELVRYKNEFKLSYKESDFRGVPIQIEIKKTNNNSIEVEMKLDFEFKMCLIIAESSP